VEGESITQLLRCERMRLLRDMLVGSMGTVVVDMSVIKGMIDLLDGHAGPSIRASLRPTATDS